MVDGIGKGGPPRGVGPSGPATGPTRPTETGKTFDVHKSDAPREAQGAAPVVTETSPLEQLKSGKIDFNQYVDLKLHEATSHLEGLSPAQLDTIRSMLRDRMATDPELIDLVKQATGHAPSVPEE
jgi:hypothetical protein